MDVNMVQVRREENGLTRHDTISGPELFIVSSFISLALYNVLELTVLILTTFKKRSGVYFWSMVVATWGIALNAIGYLLKFLRPEASRSLETLYTILVLTGWSTMITGQSVVLFSRLHLLVYDRFTIRFVLAMIIIDAIICHPPTIALFSLFNNSANPDPYSAAYSVFEKTQLFIFFVQEFVISAIYIVESAKFLKSRAAGVMPAPPSGAQAASSTSASLTESNKMIMYWLIGVNVVVVMLDVSILALEFSGFYDLQTSWKAFVYSTKLKLEFSILNQLITVVKTRNPDLFDSAGVKLRSLGGRSESGRNLDLANDSPPHQKQGGDVDQDTSVKALSFHTGFSDTSAAAAIGLGLVPRTKDINSSRSEIPCQSDGRIPNFYIVRRS